MPATTFLLNRILHFEILFYRKTKKIIDFTAFRKPGIIIKHRQKKIILD